MSNKYKTPKYEDLLLLVQQIESLANCELLTEHWTGGDGSEELHPILKQLKTALLHSVDVGTNALYAATRA